MIEKSLDELGLSLGDAKPPVGNYLGSTRIGELLFASGRVSECTGEVGTEVTVEEAREAAK
jgi:hypothetical protein